MKHKSELIWDDDNNNEDEIIDLSRKDDDEVIDLGNNNTVIETIPVDKTPNEPEFDNDEGDAEEVEEIILNVPPAAPAKPRVKKQDPIDKIVTDFRQPVPRVNAQAAYTRMYNPANPVFGQMQDISSDNYMSGLSNFYRNTAQDVHSFEDMVTNIIYSGNKRLGEDEARDKDLGAFSGGQSDIAYARAYEAYENGDPTRMLSYIANKVNAIIQSSELPCGPAYVEDGRIFVTNFMGQDQDMPIFTYEELDDPKFRPEVDTQRIGRDETGNLMPIPQDSLANYTDIKDPRFDSDTEPTPGKLPINVLGDKLIADEGWKNRQVPKMSAITIRDIPFEGYDIFHDDKRLNKVSSLKEAYTYINRYMTFNNIKMIKQ